MSEDPKEKPKKLQLSRDAHPTRGETSSRSAANVPDRETPQNGDKANDSLPNSDAAPPPKTPTAATEPPTPETRQGPPKLPGRGPNPEGSAAPESTASRASNSKLKLSQNSDTGQTTQPTAENGQNSQLDPVPASAATDSGENTTPQKQNRAPEAATEPHSILPSLLVVCLLFLVLGAAGFGLWKIVFSQQSAAESQQGSAMTSNEAGDGDAAEGAEDGEGAEEASPKNPIERAKQTIAKVPQVDIDQLTGNPDPADATTPQVESSAVAVASETVANGDAGSGVATTTSSTQAVEIRTEPPAKTKTKESSTQVQPMKSSPEIELTKAAVSEFLASLHIGGMRQGARPMVLIDGEAHTVGDVVQAETGLKFGGVRDGKLAFIDENDVIYLKSF